MEKKIINIRKSLIEEWKTRIVDVNKWLISMQTSDSSFEDYAFELENKVIEELGKIESDFSDLLEYGDIE